MLWAAALTAQLENALSELEEVANRMEQRLPAPPARRVAARAPTGLPDRLT